MGNYKIVPLENKVNATVSIPGSKSYTNRALIMAALAEGETVLTGTSESDDSVAMIEALKILGIEIRENGTTITVTGNGGNFKPFTGTLNVGAAGTTMRFLSSLAAIVPGEIILDGSERMRERPIFELVNALRAMGVKIEYLGKDGCPPIRITGGNFQGGSVEMDGSFSSQYFTSLLLIAPVLEKGIEIKVKDEQVSKSYIDMTVDGMESFGVKVKNHDYQKYIVTADNKYHPREFHIEGDASGAAYFFAIAALNRGTITVKNIFINSAQGDAKFSDLLAKMGCIIKKNEQGNSITLTGTENLVAITGPVDMESMPDTAQPLAIVAAFAKGTTHLTGLSTLRIKETDRIAAMQNELAKCGIKSEVGPDWIKIDGGEMQGAQIATYKDHRMAMSFAAAGTKIENMIIEEPNVVSKSFPEFWEMLKVIGTIISEV